MKKILVVAAGIALATFARADMLYWQVNSEATSTVASDYSYAKVLYANDYVRNESQVLTSYINGETSVGTDPAKGVIDATGGLFADLSSVSGITDWTGYQFVVELYGERGNVLANSGWQTFSNLRDAHAIIEEAMKDDMAHAWLLVAGPLLDRGYNLPPLADAVSAYINTTTAKDTKAAMSRAEEALGIMKMHLDPDRVKSPVELEAFKKKVWKVAMHTALCVIYLALERLIDKDELKEIIFSADLTLAEVESGINSFDELQEELLERTAELGMIEERE